MLGIFVVTLCVGINVAQTLAVAAYPYTPGRIFTDTHDGTGEVFLEMTEQAMVGAETIEAVFVRTHPATSFAVDKGTDDTSLSNIILFVELIAHVTEFRNLLGLHEDAFLQQSQPYVAASIFYDGVDFTHAQVYVTAEIGIVFYLAALWIVDGQSHTIVTKHHLAVTATIDGRNMFMACYLDMLKVTTIG